MNTKLELQTSLISYRHSHKKELDDTSIERIKNPITFILEGTSEEIIKKLIRSAALVLAKSESNTEEEFESIFKTLRSKFIKE